jgi:hypothetical protein
MADSGRIVPICRALGPAVPTATMYAAMTAANGAVAPASSLSPVGAANGDQLVVAYGNGGFEWG